MYVVTCVWQHACDGNAAPGVEPLELDLVRRDKLGVGSTRALDLQPAGGVSGIGGSVGGDSSWVSEVGGVTGDFFRGRSGNTFVGAPRNFNSEN